MYPTLPLRRVGNPHTPAKDPSGAPTQKTSDAIPRARIDSPAPARPTRQSPRPLTLTSANITSWNAGWPHALAAAQDRGCQILCLQETRLTADRGRSARGLARAAGWALHLAPAVRTGMRGPAPGGVAIAVRRPRGSAPMDPGAAHKAATEGRFTACAVEGGPGTPPHGHRGHLLRPLPGGRA